MKLMLAYFTLCCTAKGITDKNNNHDKFALGTIEDSAIVNDDSKEKNRVLSFSF